jgi:hypothetical protein
MPNIETLLSQVWRKKIREIKFRKFRELKQLSKLGSKQVPSVEILNSTVSVGMENRMKIRR